MKIEKIDTTTTAGKIEVMRLADEGRLVVQRTFPNENWIRQSAPAWDWRAVDYAIVFEEVGPSEVWVEIDDLGRAKGCHTYGFCSKGNVAVRYVREDLTP